MSDDEVLLPSEIEYGVPVTIEPKEKYVGGYWFDRPGAYTIEWDRRMEEAVKRDRAKVLAAGEDHVDQAGDFVMQTHQKLRWEDVAEIFYDEDTAEFGFDPQAIVTEIDGEDVTPNSVSANDITTNTFFAQDADTDYLFSDLADITELGVGTADFDEIHPTVANIGDLDATTANVDSLTVNQEPTNLDHAVRKTELDGKADDPHDNTVHSETYAVDGDPQPPESHDNTAHLETYAVDGDPQPPESHDNTAHLETYAIDGDTQPPESHDNTDHLETYAIDGDPQPPEAHDNTAHSVDYADVATSETITGEWAFGSLVQIPHIEGQPISTGTGDEWFKIATIDGAGANCKVLVTETSRTGNTHETGVEFAAFKNGNNTGEHGGFWYQLQPGQGRIQEGDFGYIETGDMVMDVYYKAGPFTKASLVVIEGDGTTYNFESIGSTEPTGIEYINEKFPVASPAELANGADVTGDFDVSNGLLTYGGSEVAIDGDTQPPEDHDNTAHLETYAVDGDPQPPEDHDNTAHLETYSVDGHDHGSETLAFTGISSSITGGATLSSFVGDNLSIDADGNLNASGGGSDPNPADLSTVTGDTIGQTRVDDGTNTPSGHEELCLWVDADGAGDTKWQIVGTETYIEVN